MLVHPRLIDVILSDVGILIGAAYVVTFGVLLIAGVWTIEAISASRARRDRETL